MSPKTDLPTKRGLALCFLSALILVAALFVNFAAQRHLMQGQTAEWTETDFTFLETDYPPSLIPLSRHPRNAALVVEESVHYHPNVSSEWASLFPTGSGGFVRLGPQNRLFGVSMFHQLHCLDKMRRAVIQAPPSEWESWHTQHCLNYLRQMLLCSASMRLEPVKGWMGGETEGLKVDGIGLKHQCRDWSLLRNEVERNFERWTGNV